MNERRPIGAPRGNTNALKHGFYSTRAPTSPGQEGLEDAGTLNLSAEIALLRLSIRRVLELTPPDETLDSARETLRLLCLASTAISRLVRAHYFVRADENNEMQDEIGRIVDDMRAELALHSSRRPPLDPGCDPIRIKMGLPTSDSYPDPDQDLDDPGPVQGSLPSRSRFETPVPLVHPQGCWVAALPKGSRDTLGAPAGVAAGVGGPGVGGPGSASDPDLTPETEDAPLESDIAPRSTAPAGAGLGSNPPNRRARLYNGPAEPPPASSIPAAVPEPITSHGFSPFMDYTYGKDPRRSW